MSPETAFAALDLAARSKEPFHVQLAGGEPVLALDLVERISARLRETNAPATIALQTNGTLTDSKLIEICRRYRIEIGLSLDGPPRIHELQRGQAAATFRGLALLAEAEIPVRVTTVLTSVNSDQLVKLALTLAAYENVAGFGLDALVDKGRAVKDRSLVPDENQVVHGIRALMKTLSFLGKNRRISLRWRELDAVRAAMSGMPGEHDYCHACRGESLAVHPDGTTYPCAQTIGDPSAVVGNVKHVDWERLRGFYNNVKMNDDCGDCPLSGRCPGDCPSRLRYNALRKYTIMCTVYRTIAEEIYKV